MWQTQIEAKDYSSIDRLIKNQQHNTNRTNTGIKLLDTNYTSYSMLSILLGIFLESAYCFEPSILFQWIYVVDWSRLCKLQGKVNINNETIREMTSGTMWKEGDCVWRAVIMTAVCFNQYWTINSNSSRHARSLASIPWRSPFVCIAKDGMSSTDLAELALSSLRKSLTSCRKYWQANKRK